MQRAAAFALVLSGGIALAVGGGAHVERWQELTAWERSDEAARVQARLEAPAAVIVAADEPAPALITEWQRPTAPPPAPTATTRVMPPVVADRGDRAAAGPAPTPAPPRRDFAAPEEIELGAVEFRYLEPPEPGAHARLAVTLKNAAEAPTRGISLALPTRWLDRFTIIGAAPGALADRAETDGLRYFDFEGLPAANERGIELHLTARDDDIDPPTVRLLLTGGDALGETRPRTLAPPPRPGFVKVLDLPSLGIRTGVVPTAWEPPPFVVGQLNNSARLNQGNTVLIGHLNGLAGNVFANLDRIQVGDTIVAQSRGVDTPFVVSDTLILPNDDQAPMLESDDPRLTLMTCTGHWDPLAREYSHRFWVIAEPPELARARIRANEEAIAAALAAETAAVPTPAPPSAIRAAASPTPRAAVPRQPGAGIEVKFPPNGARVTRELAVQGIQTRPTPAGGHVWMFVRPLVQGGRWYLVPSEITAGADGQWLQDLTLDGPPNIRHEIRVGVVDAETHRLLVDGLRRRPGEPLAGLPERFSDDARVVVTRL